MKKILNKSMKSFKRFLIEKRLLNISSFPSSIFGNLDVMVMEKLSSNKRTVFYVRSNDRESDRDGILKRLNDSGISSTISRSTSSIDPVDGSIGDMNFRIFVKPRSGGKQETTLNASITELFPAIAFEKKFRPGGVDSFYEFLKGVNVSSLKCVSSSDRQAAEKTIENASLSSKFEEKMMNAMQILNFLHEKNSVKPIKHVYWGYRAKPRGVPKNHPGDIFLEYNDGNVIGVSLKAGDKKSKEPLLNTFVRPIFEFFGELRMLSMIERVVYDTVYSKISDDFPPFDTFQTRQQLRRTKEILEQFYSSDRTRYESFYDNYLDIMRSGVVDLFNKDKQKSKKFISEKILRDAPNVPTIVIKATKNSYHEVTDANEIGVFLPQIEFIRAYVSDRSKQNWFIELKAGKEKVTMIMSIRTNKPGGAGDKKLGQFSLAVKFNGIL